MENGGIIGVINTPTSDTASGVWQQEEQYQAQTTGTWPPIPSIGVNSARFNPASSDYLNRSPSSAGNLTTWTLSMWVKRSILGGEKPLFSCRPDGNNETFVGFGGSDTLVYKQKTSGSTSGQIVTNRVFRDTSAWYNLVFVYEINNGTAGDRGRLYVNGVRETSFSAQTNFSQNSSWNSTTSNAIGISQSAYFDGYMSEVNFVDGQALTPTSFGVSNSNGVWTPIIPTVSSYGTNGFRLKFENASNLGEDAGPNGNNFTVNNLTSVDQSADYPVNNFATLNPLALTTRQTLSDGNLTGTASSWKSAISTIAITTGKWFSEVKYVDATGAIMVGVMDEKDMSSLTGLGFTTNSVGYYKDGTKFIADSETSYGASYTANDILGIALDLDSGTKTVTFYKNGASQGAINLPTTGTGTFFIGTSSTSNGKSSINFGHPPYAVASGNADGNGYGNFEYTVPSGYYSLCTKNLAEFG